MVSRLALCLLVGSFAVFDASRADAGAPFFTDDPVPIDYRRWQLNVGVQYQDAGFGPVTASYPFAELDYGIMPNVQLSLLAQLAENDDGDTHVFGRGDTQLGAKFRFVQETDGCPQVAFNPDVFFPGIEGGHVVTFLPLFAQKTFGRWTASGGGGIYLNPGPGMLNYGFYGATLQRQLSPAVSLGIEGYHQGATSVGGPELTAATLGATIDLGEHHALLFSLGHSLSGPGSSYSAYGSYQFDFGPRASERP